MKIPLFDPTRDKKEMKEIKKTVADIIDSGRYILGEQVEKFEKEFARYVGVKHCIGVNSGTDALIAAYIACNIENKELIIPANTFIATSNAGIYAGGIPRFVDIDPETYNINPSLIKKNITSMSRIIVPVHLFGHPCKMDEIMDLARERYLFVVEDCAQAHGAKFNDKKVGSFGDVGCFSFYPSKNLGCLGDGGAIVTNNEEIAEKLRFFRDHGQTKKYYHDFFGINTRLDAIQAAVLKIKLKNLDRKNRDRRKIVELYEEVFRDSGLIEKIILPVEKEWAYHVYYVFVIRVQKKIRNDLINHLQKNGVGAQIHYPIPIHKQEFYTYYQGISFPVTEKCADEMISLPLFPGMTEEEVLYVVDKIKQGF